MNTPIIPKVYDTGIPLVRVQSYIGESDFRLLFHRTYWLRGSQDRIIGRLLYMFAALLRKAGYDGEDLNDIDLFRFLESLQLTSTYNGNFSTTYSDNSTTVTSNSGS